MRFNRDTESKARTIDELDAFKDHKPQPIDRDRLWRALIAAGWSPTFFSHYN